MSITHCPTCGHENMWSWSEAFDKFGFEDGDGIVMTDHVANVLRKAGFTVTVERWGLHNVTIASIQRDGVELIPAHIQHGHDDPRDYLSKDIIGLLDEAFPEYGEVQL